MCTQEGKGKISIFLIWSFPRNLNYFVIPKMSKTVAEDLKKVSIYALRKCAFRSNIYEWKNCGEVKGEMGVKTFLLGQEKYMNFEYVVTDRDTSVKKDYNYNVAVITTPCHFGNSRYWFECPNFNCKKRVAMLFGYRGVFVCRHCVNLTYNSRNHSRTVVCRWLNQDRKIQELEKKIKRQTWKGVPTKKVRRYQMLRGQFIGSSRLMNEKASTAGL
jgi:hypothetical protein